MKREKSFWSSGTTNPYKNQPPPTNGHVYSPVVCRCVYLTNCSVLHFFLHYVSYSLCLELTMFFVLKVISYLLLSFRTNILLISYPVTTILYPSHFVPSLIISSNEYEMTICWSFCTQVISSLFWSHIEISALNG